MPRQRSSKRQDEAKVVAKLNPAAGEAARALAGQPFSSAVCCVLVGDCCGGSSSAVKAALNDEHVEIVTDAPATVARANTRAVRQIDGSASLPEGWLPIAIQPGRAFAAPTVGQYEMLGATGPRFTDPLGLTRYALSVPTTRESLLAKLPRATFLCCPPITSEGGGEAEPCERIEEGKDGVPSPSWAACAEAGEVERAWEWLGCVSAEGCGGLEEPYGRWEQRSVTRVKWRGIFGPEHVERAAKKVEAAVDAGDAEWGAVTAWAHRGAPRAWAGTRMGEACFSSLGVPRCLSIVSSRGKERALLDASCSSMRDRPLPF